GVKVGVDLDNVTRQKRKLARGGDVVRLVETRRVLEGGLGKSQGARLLGHASGEQVLRPRHVFGNRDCGIVAGLHRNAFDQLLRRAPRANGTSMGEVPDGAPPLRHAFSLIKYSSLSLTSAALSALKSTVSVMSLLMLAGYMSSSALRWYMIAPVSASIRM